MSHRNLSHARLLKILHYERDTGSLTWRIRKGGKANAGTEAGWIGNHGYRSVSVDRRTYLVHRLAWFYVHGVWPIEEIDHRDGDKLNNRLTNLRLASSSQNKVNTRRRADNTSGQRGVTFDRSRGKWIAQIHIDGQHKHLGRFSSAEAAGAAYVAKAKEVFGEFARAP